MSYHRISHYYPGHDGTKLAVDLYLPDTEETVPFLLKAGYDKRRHQFETEKESMERFLEAGYAIAIVEVRGSGASYGHSDGFFGLHDGKDLACIIQALAAESWCSGVCATYGGSNYGMSQEITAIEQPEALRAIAACDCSMDFYDQDFPNGASALPEMVPEEHRRKQDQKDPASDQIIPEETQDPVDEDPDGCMLKEALSCHDRNLPFLAQHVKNMFRDDVNPRVGYRPNLDVPAWERMDVMRHGHVNSFAIGSWYDPGCTNKILTWKSWGGQLLLGPWPHCGIYGNHNFGLPDAEFDWAADHLRYFDQYLKNADNGFAKEPPVRYYTVGDSGNEWKYEEDFPVEGTLFAKWHLTEEHQLSETVPVSGKAVRYQVRNDVMIYGPGMRMNRNVEKDMKEEDAKSAVFTSDPLPQEMEITGVPVIELHVKSTHPDGNFIAVLEEVTPDGASHFLTEGVIRASHAKTHRNDIYGSMGLPYHRGFREDRVEIPESDSLEEPLLLSFHLEALSRVLAAGSRIRIAISCGGSGYQQPEGFPEDVLPTVSLYTGEGTDSVLILPVVKPWRTHFTDESGTEVWLFRTSVYLKKDGKFNQYPVKQVYPAGKIGEEQYIYETDAFRAELRVQEEHGLKTASLALRGPGVPEDGRSGYAAQGDGQHAGVLSDDGICFKARTVLPGRYVPQEASREIPLPRMPWGCYPEHALRNLYVATVPVAKGAPGNMDPMLRKSFDLLIDLVYPEKGGRMPSPGSAAEKTPASYPVIVNIHGFGGSHHQFEQNTPEFLKRGYAVASIDYRLTPPCTWEAPVYDAKACIRFLKAHANELSLDPDRIGIIGGSMGGYLTGMIAAANGAPETEGDIGGNRSCEDVSENGNGIRMIDSSVKASVTEFGPMDLLHFGDDAEEVWPGRPDKRANGDGPFAPPASMIGYTGPGKGVADLKKHLNDPDPEYRRLLAELRKASPVSHVTENSAPICLVHGMYDCGIQVPMGQSVRMFDAYTRKGVKALLFCNNLGIYGEDPEAAEAIISFLAARV